jgi:hypothetical protein
MFSLPKILVLIVILVAVWVLYTAIKRRGVSGIFRSTNAKETKAGPAQPKALEMEKCRICGDFVPADTRACAQTRCPYPVP